MDTNTLLIGDCRRILPTLPAGCADLVFGDPPFNIDLAYSGSNDCLTREVYLDFTDRWLAAVHHVLSPSGSLFVQIADEWAGYLQVRLDGLGLTRRNTLVRCYRFGPHQKKFTPSHQAILYYLRDPNRFPFNADAVRVPSDRQTKYNDKRADPRGRVPGDVWHLSRICGTFKERQGHVCQTPLRLLDRVILASSNAGDLVLDPMAGTGTALLAAKQLGRRYLGIEKCAATAELARRRLKDAELFLPGLLDDRPA